MIDKLATQGERLAFGVAVRLFGHFHCAGLGKKSFCQSPLHIAELGTFDETFLQSVPFWKFTSDPSQNPGRRRAFPPFIDAPVSLDEHLSPRAVLEKTMMQALGVNHSNLAKRFLTDSGMTWNETPPRLAAPNGRAVYRFEPAPEFWSRVVNFLKREASAASPTSAPTATTHAFHSGRAALRLFPL